MNYGDIFARISSFARNIDDFESTDQFFLIDPLSRYTSDFKKKYCLLAHQYISEGRIFRKYDKIRYSSILERLEHFFPEFLEEQASGLHIAPDLREIESICIPCSISDFLDLSSLESRFILSASIDCKFNSLKVILWVSHAILCNQNDFALKILSLSNFESLEMSRMQFNDDLYRVCTFGFGSNFDFSKTLFEKFPALRPFILSSFLLWNHFSFVDSFFSIYNPSSDKKNEIHFLNLILDFALYGTHFQQVLIIAMKNSNVKCVNFLGALKYKQMIALGTFDYSRLQFDLQVLSQFEATDAEINFWKSRHIPNLQFCQRRNVCVGRVSCSTCVVSDSIITDKPSSDRFESKQNLEPLDLKISSSPLYLKVTSEQLEVSCDDSNSNHKFEMTDEYCTFVSWDNIGGVFRYKREGRIGNLFRLASTFEGKRYGYNPSSSNDFSEVDHYCLSQLMRPEVEPFCFCLTCESVVHTLRRVSSHKNKIYVDYLEHILNSFDISFVSCQFRLNEEDMELICQTIIDSFSFAKDPHFRLIHPKNDFEKHRRVPLFSFPDAHEFDEQISSVFEEEPKDIPPSCPLSQKSVVEKDRLKKFLGKYSASTILETMVFQRRSFASNTGCLTSSLNALYARRFRFDSLRQERIKKSTLNLDYFEKTNSLQRPHVLFEERYRQDALNRETLSKIALEQQRARYYDCFPLCPPTNDDAEVIFPFWTTMFNNFYLKNYEKDHEASHYDFFSYFIILTMTIGIFQSDDPHSLMKSISEFLGRPVSLSIFRVARDKFETLSQLTKKSFHFLICEQKKYPCENKKKVEVIFPQMRALFQHFSSADLHERLQFGHDEGQLEDLLQRKQFSSEEQNVNLTFLCSRKIVSFPARALCLFDDPSRLNFEDVNLSVCKLAVFRPDFDKDGRFQVWKLLRRCLGVIIKDPTIIFLLKFNASLFQEEVNCIDFYHFDRFFSSNEFQKVEKKLLFDIVDVAIQKGFFQRHNINLNFAHWLLRKSSDQEWVFPVCSILLSYPNSPIWSLIADHNCLQIGKYMEITPYFYLQFFKHALELCRKQSSLDSFLNVDYVVLNFEIFFGNFLAFVSDSEQEGSVEDVFDWLQCSQLDILLTLDLSNFSFLFRTLSEKYEEFRELIFDDWFVRFMVRAGRDWHKGRILNWSREVVELFISLVGADSKEFDWRAWFDQFFSSMAAADVNYDYSFENILLLEKMIKHSGYDCWWEYDVFVSSLNLSLLHMALYGDKFIQESSFEIEFYNFNFQQLQHIIKNIRHSRPEIVRMSVFALIGFVCNKMFIEALLQLELVTSFKSSSMLPIMSRMIANLFLVRNPFKHLSVHNFEHAFLNKFYSVLANSPLKSGGNSEPGVQLVKAVLVDQITEAIKMSFNPSCYVLPAFQCDSSFLVRKFLVNPLQVVSVNFTNSTCSSLEKSFQDFPRGNIRELTACWLDLFQVFLDSHQSFSAVGYPQRVLFSIQELSNFDLFGFEEKLIRRIIFSENFHSSIFFRCKSIIEVDNFEF
eukprot:GDKJ01002479.1.p1 GENE.GDKJ01002479.1~~GDKJ01002479.1.p1  ORF type:complete len:1520 (-),score=237.29 GDKJ01002479.1:49-4578(-)